jgi:hypothetical protein
MKVLFFALLLSLSGCTVYQMKGQPMAVAEPMAMGYGGYGYPMMGFGGYGFGYGGWGSGLGININKTSVNNYSPTVTNVNRGANVARPMAAPMMRSPSMGMGFRR